MNRDSRLTLAAAVASGLAIAAVAFTCESVWLRSTIASTGAGVTATGTTIALAIEHYA